MIPIFNLGIFGGAPEMALAEYLIGMGVTFLVVLIPIILVFMTVQRS
jgi:hypothetical protein